MDYANLYRKTLIEDVVPFWLRHAFGSPDGAINNCMDDAGNVLSRDRYIWSQGRALWTFSALYNRIEPRPEWLEAARGIFGYLASHGRDEQGRWVYRLDENGGILDRDISIYVDGFVANGLDECFRATRDGDAAQMAVETFESIRRRIARPGSYGIAPYRIPEGGKAFGIAMIFSFFFHELSLALRNEEMKRMALDLAGEVLDGGFYDRERSAVLEFVRAPSGGRLDIPEGRVCVPGHVIEAAWFLITIFEVTGGARAIERCCDLIRRHIELGWDHEYGGIRLALDVDGLEPVAWQKADCKPWWVQVEALIATAYAWKHGHQDWAADWHERIREFAYSHYPVATGEWTQWLDRQGNKAASAALPVKDPFHLPRALIYLVSLLER